MKVLINKLLFKTRPPITDSKEDRNPWLKEGDLIYLHSKNGRFEVVSIAEDGFYVVKEGQRKNLNPEFHSWNNFKRWSGKATISKV